MTNITPPISQTVTEKPKKPTDIIIARYRIIFTIVFDYGLYVLSLIVFYLTFNYLIQLDHRAPITVNITDNTTKNLIQQFENLTSQDAQKAWFQIKIVQGVLTGNNIQESRDNLITYKWYVLPRNIFVDINFNLDPIDYFSNPWYDMMKLELFLKNMVFTRNRDVKQSTFVREQKKTQWTLKEFFMIKCLEYPRLWNGICDVYVSHFLKVMFVYDLSPHYRELTELYNNMKWNFRYAREFCNQLKNYLFYSNDTNIELQTLFQNCWSQYREIFELFKGFSDIQWQLYGYITDSTYPQRELNAYKLLSIQQNIFNDFSNGRVDQIRIEAYIKFLQQALRRSWLEQFYIDLTAFFNNYYLLPQLQTTQLWNILQQSELTRIVNDFRELNKWSRLIWFTWLQDIVLNKNIFDRLNTWSHEQLKTHSQKDILTLFKEQVNFAQYVITTQQVSNNKMDVQWAFVVVDELNGSRYNLRAGITFVIINDLVKVQQVLFGDYPQLSNLINNQLKNQPLTLNQIYQTIIKNKDIYETTQVEFDICGIIETAISQIWAIVASCNTKQIVIEKKETWLDPSLSWRIYTFELDGVKITNFNVNDSELQKEIPRQFSLRTQQDTLAPRIANIVNYELPRQEVQTWSAELILVYEKFQTYIGVKPTTVAQMSWRFIVEFSVDNINFVGWFGIDNFEISPLRIIQNERIKVKNFSLKLDNSDLFRINAFVLDPLQYIGSVDPEALRALWELQQKQ